MAVSPRLRFICLLVLILSFIALSGRAAAAELPERCGTLASIDLSNVMDAPTRLITVEQTGAAAEVPSYCHVTGYVASNIGVEIGLPATWNGKLIEIGCAGFCGGTKFLLNCGPALSKGYACVASDMGHRSTDGDALWAYNNPQAGIDHGYRAGHVAALAAKAIVIGYYGLRPRHSYFMGCSTGGRQAMMEAQRFPWDFDGIIAGAPSLSVTGVHMNLLWANRALIGPGGEPILKQADLDLLHKAVVTKCDSNDGIKDGLIGDPRACSFDPAELACKTESSNACLRPQQIDAVRKIYSGPINSKGEPIYFAGAFKGSERTWLDWFTGGPASHPGGIYNFVREEFRYSAFDPNAGPEWKPEDFDFDRDYQRFGVTEGLSSALDPDLRRFEAAGGKLLVYMGWNDVTGVGAVTDYYETAERTLGGRAATQSFFRLFAIPGMNHCTGGEGAFAVDYLSYLEAWVEKGRAPDELLSVRARFGKLNPDTPGDILELVRRTQYPLDPATIEFARPVYPYPTVTRYLGHGDSKSAVNFGPQRSSERRPNASP
jgi:hypothetical protein